jgi:hypothetical protein
VEIPNHLACALGNDEERVGCFMAARDALDDSRRGVRLFDRRLSRGRINQSCVLGWHSLLPNRGDCIRIRLGSVANQDIGHSETLTDLIAQLSCVGIVKALRDARRAM